MAKPRKKSAATDAPIRAPRRLGIGERGDPRPPLDLLQPFDSDQMKMTPANPAVGNVNNNGPDMLDEPGSLHSL